MVTRSSLVWVMTGIAAGIAGGWLWNRERPIDVATIPMAATRAEPIRSPFVPRREARASYLTESGSGPALSANATPPAPAGESQSDFSHRRALYASASQADRAQLDAMITDAKALANAVERRSTLEILLLRYAELDVDGALGHAMDADRETATRLMATLAAVAPDRAWERAAQASDPAERLAYLNAVISTWAAQEPQDAFTKVMQLPAEWQRSELLQQVIGVIAPRDPLLAIELVGTMEPPAAASLLELIAGEWSRHDPAAAARWVESKPRSEQGRLAYAVAEAYVAQKPTEALAWAVRISSSPRRYLWSSMLGQMAAYKPYEALQLAQAAESPAQRSQGMGKVLATIAQTNPGLAMSHLMKLPAGDLRMEILGEIAGSVAALTPTAAIDWLNDIDDKRMQFQAARSLGWSLSRRDVEAAAQLVDRIPKEARSSWITSVALAYADADFERGRQWARKYSNEPGEATFQFARTIAARSPDLAVQLVEGVTDDKERDRLLAGILPPLAEHAPETAARWAERVSDADARERALGEVANIWAQYDQAGARKWILSLEDGPARDQGLTTLVMKSGTPLDETLPIINQIQTPERRMHAVLMTAMRFAQSDPESARTLLRRYPLDPARQRQFDDYVQRRNKGQ